MPETPHIALGRNRDGSDRHSLPVYDQSWARIVNRLGRLIDGLGESALAELDGFDPESLVHALGDKLYEAVEIFVPNLPDKIGKDEFEHEDTAATIPQLVAAFETFFAINGGERLLKMLGGVFDPKLVKAELNLMATDALETWRDSRSTGSPNSPSPSDGSAPPPNSGTSDPIEEPSASLEAELERPLEKPISNGTPQPVVTG